MAYSDIRNKVKSYGTKTISLVTILCVIPKFWEGCLPLTSGYILALVFTHGIIGVYRIPNSSLHTHTAYSVLSTEIVRAYIYAVQGSSPAILADSLSIHFWASQEMSPGDNFFLRPPRSKLSSMYRLLRIQGRHASLNIIIAVKLNTFS